MPQYHTRPLRRNDIGLPIDRKSHIPALAERQAHKAKALPDGLTPGGRALYRQAPRPVSTMNLLAALAGLGTEIDNAR